MIAPVILARGDDFLVADKPAGLATTGRTLDDPDCLQSALMTHLQRRKVWAVHQLDKGTSGLCLFALRKPSVAAWAARLKAGQKRYLGLVDGQLVGTHEVHDIGIQEALCDRDPRVPMRWGPMRPYEIGAHEAL